VDEDGANWYHLLCRNRVLKIRRLC
jgi:hypothetical protein